MSLVDKLNQNQSNHTMQGKQRKSDGRGGFGKRGISRHGMGNNSMNEKTGTTHMARALGGNISPNGLGNINTSFDDDVEFDED